MLFITLRLKKFNIKVKKMTESYKAVSSITVNPTEIEKFSKIADQWWDPNGKYRPLHQFNPVRLRYILDTINKYFNIDQNANLPLKGLRILDIGCGGGLMCEPLARLGASMVGIDASYKNIEVCKLHASKSELTIDYRMISLEELVSTGEQFDIVLNLEVVEHVNNVSEFMASCIQAIKPEGIVFVATLNRTLKALALAIIGAEYILRWLPRGTHSIKKFLKPDEIKSYLTKGNVEVISETGIIYNLLYNKWCTSSDMSVNYMIAGKKN